MTTYIFTSADRNYLPKVRLLAESFKRYHPSIVFVLVLVDKFAPEQIPEGAWDEVLLAENLKIDRWHAWAFAHRVVELATAVKPFALKHLLDRPGCSRVFYFDPDIVVYSSLDDLLHFGQQQSIKLTPHQTTANIQWQDIADHEISSLQHGIYNLGFIGVNKTDVGKQFAAWWSQMLFWFCRDDTSSGLFTDQKWVDLAPALFPEVVIERSPRFNVAPWNISNRSITISDDGQYLANGLPLGFYHFTGFDSGAHRMTTLAYQPKNATLMTMIDWYDEKTRRTTSPNEPGWFYGCYSNGQPILDIHRLVYRFSPTLQARYANPFECGSDGDTGYFEWLCTQSDHALRRVVESSRTQFRYLPTLASSDASRGGGDNAEFVLAAMVRPGGLRLLLRRAATAFRRDGPGVFFLKSFRLARRVAVRVIQRK